MTTPAAETKSIGLLADALLSWFLHLHQDNFIVTWQILLIYRDSLIWTTLSWQPNPAHLSGLCKNSCQPRHRRQLILTTGPLAFRPGCADMWDNLYIAWQFRNLDRWPVMLTDKASCGRRPNMKPRCTTSLQLLIRENLYYGDSIFCVSFRREVDYYFQIATDSKVHYEPDSTMLWGTACLRLLTFM